MATEPRRLPIEVKIAPGGPPAILLAGCGGTGSRTLPLLVQSLPSGSRIILSDPDTVEERNCIRQPFLPRHVGMPKVAVMLARYQAEAQRRGITLEGYQLPVGEVLNTTTGNLYIGCVDNNAAREVLWQQMLNFGGVYIDAGNELRTGQVVLNFQNATIKLTGDPYNYLASLYALPKLFPNLLRQEEGEATPSCGAIVLDSQTLQINTMAAAWIGAMIAWIIDEIPFSVAAVRFSTIGAHLPIPILGYDLTSEQLQVGV